MVTIESSDCDFRSLGIDSAPLTAPRPKVADSRPNPPASVLSRSRAISGSSAQKTLAHSANARLRKTNARIAGECRA